jgi:hypothetical protein
MGKRWILTKRPDPSRWTWRLLNVDGSIEQQSGEFEDYGAAVHDAILRGFNPRQDHWVIETKHTVVHYAYGKSNVTVPKAANELRLGDRGFPFGRKRFAKNFGVPVGKKRFPQKQGS